MPTSRELTIDETEIEDARWFTRAQVADAMANGQDAASFIPPPRTAIAHHLLQHWLENTDMSTPMVVDIWSDVMCPWCLVGWRSFMEGARLASDEVEVTIRWMPFELNPQMPPEGKLQAEHLAQTYNRSAEEIEAMRAELSGAAERVGFPISRWQGEGERRRR